MPDCDLSKNDQDANKHHMKIVLSLMPQVWGVQRKRSIEPSKDEILLGHWKITVDVLLLNAACSISAIGKKFVEKETTPKCATLELSGQQILITGLFRLTPVKRTR
ncbi:hypothetical protein F1880_004168 [Penicillium rolfsii]|nr:hypothetical protein F1880_004168 [Penicillium rolfsii]